MRLHIVPEISEHRIRVTKRLSISQISEFPWSLSFKGVLSTEQSVLICGNILFDWPMVFGLILQIVPAEASRTRRCGKSSWSCARLSWKVQYRTFLWFFSQMSKLYRARSLLYWRQILQENIRWKALDEIYKIYMLLHRSDLNISENCRQTFWHFSANLKFCRNSLFWILFGDFCSDFDEILSEFRRYFRKCWNFPKFWIF